MKRTFLISLPNTPNVGPMLDAAKVVLATARNLGCDIQKVRFAMETGVIEIVQQFARALGDVPIEGQGNLTNGTLLCELQPILNHPVVRESAKTKNYWAAIGLEGDLSARYDASSVCYDEVVLNSIEEARDGNATVVIASREAIEMGLAYYFDDFPVLGLPQVTLVSMESIDHNATLELLVA